MKRILLLLFVLLIFYFFIACSDSELIKNNTNIQNQANSDESVLKITNAETEVNNASVNVNIIKNSNNNGLSNDELRNRIINAARKINFNKWKK